MVFSAAPSLLAANLASQSMVSAPSLLAAHLARSLAVCLYLSARACVLRRRADDPGADFQRIRRHQGQPGDQTGFKLASVTPLCSCTRNCGVN